MEREGSLDFSSVNHTCSDSGSSDESISKFVIRHKRKMLKNLEETDSESEFDIFKKRSRGDENLPKYIDGNSCQNQEGYFGHLLDCSYNSSTDDSRCVHFNISFVYFSNVCM